MASLLPAYSDSDKLYAADLNDRLKQAIDRCGGQDLYNAIVTALCGAAIQFTIGSESGNVIRLTIQIERHDGVDITSERACVQVIITDTQYGDECTTAPSGGWAVVTGNKMSDEVTNKRAWFQSDATGTIAIDITEAGATTFYATVFSGQRVFASGAITFA